MTDLIERTCALARASNTYLKQALTDAGYPQIEPCHGDIFYVLFEHGSVGIAQLAEKTHRSKSTVSVMVSRLTKLGLVRKQENKTDARALCICLTKKGRELKPVFEKISFALNESFTRGFSKEDLKELQTALERATRNLQSDLKQ
ncbi:MAG TPA: MarR family transcriptional regulator [Sutterella sp.]|nr:MarR family transcriptional regulator [Sutterella sp.]